LCGIAWVANVQARAMPAEQALSRRSGYERIPLFCAGLRVQAAGQ